MNVHHGELVTQVRLVQSFRVTLLCVSTLTGSVRYRRILSTLKMRYFFHVSDGSNPFKDDKGTILSGPEVALLQAAVVAAELALPGT
jgi:hypothetical protein